MSENFTPTGLKIEGSYENDRNAKNSDLFKAMIREAYGAGDVIIAHHLTYVASEKRIEHGLEFEYQIVEEIPSADTLIFDHEAAEKIWTARGRDWRNVLTELALLPVEKRDQRLFAMYHQQ